MVLSGARGENAGGAPPPPAASGLAPITSLAMPRDGECFGDGWVGGKNLSQLNLVDAALLARGDLLSYACADPTPYLTCGPRN